MRRKLRFLSVLIALATMTNVAQAQTTFKAVSSKWSSSANLVPILNYQVTSDSTVECIGGLAPDFIGDLIIPNEVTYNGNTYKVTGIGSGAFRNHSGIHYVYLGWMYDLNYISSNAFYGCENISRVFIPGCCKNVFSYAFAYCTNLNGINVADGVDSIWTHAFHGCNYIDTIRLGNTVKYIGEAAFSKSWSVGPKIRHITMGAVIPPIDGSISFWDTYTQVDTLYVPCGSVEAYRNSCWGNRATIIREQNAPKVILGQGVTIDTMPYRCGQSTVVITANSSFQFVCWSDGDTTNPRQVTIDRDTVFDVVYALNGTFENPDDDGLWTIDGESGDNKWYIGRANSAGGLRGLYVSNNNGRDNRCINNGGAYWWGSPYYDAVYAYTLVYLSSGTHTISFSKNDQPLTVSICPYDSVYNWSREIFGTYSDYDTALTESFYVDTAGVYRLIFGSSEGAPMVDNITISGVPEASSNGDRWTLENTGQVNKWHIGQNDGLGQLYISYDGGATCGYDNNCYNHVYAYKTLYLNQGNNTFSYEWLSGGDGYYDFARVMLYPSTTDLVAGNGLPSNGISLDENTELYGYSYWQTKNVTVNVPSTGAYKLVFYWQNDYGWGSGCTAIRNIVVPEGSSQQDSMLTIFAESNDTLMGIVTGGGTFLEGDSITISATALNGYVFYKWSDGDTVPSRRIAVNVENFRKDFVAYFLPVEFLSASDSLIFDFEDTDKDVYWKKIDDGQVNKWYIGTAASHNSSRGMYVSSTNGNTNDYNTGVESRSYIYTTIRLDSGLYECNFDWRSYHREWSRLNSYSFWGQDYLQAALVPLSSRDIKSGELWPGDIHPLTWEVFGYTEQLAGERDWTVQKTYFVVDEPGLFYLTFLWRNDGNSGEPPAGNVDNISIIKRNDLVFIPKVNNPAFGDAVGDAAALGDSVNMIALAHPGYHLDCWNTGDTTLTIRMESTVSNANKEYIANFVPDTLLLTILEAEGGTAQGAGLYGYDDTATVIAIPAEGYFFGSWSDGNGDNPRKILMRDSLCITPRFSLANSVHVCNTVFDFENEADDAIWCFVGNRTGTSWVIDTAANHGGQRGMYISSDNGVTNSYNFQGVNVYYAYAPLHLESATYNIQYDWRAYGESSGDESDHLRVLIVTDSVSVPFSYYYRGYYEYWSDKRPVGTIPLDNENILCMRDVWKTENQTVTIPTEGEYKLCFLWYVGYDNAGLNPAAAVDNIVITKQTSLWVVGVPEDEIKGTVAGSDTVNRGDTVTLTATALPNYHFDHWSDGSTTPTIHVVADDDKILTAYFAPDSFMITAVPQSVAMGSTTGSGRYPYGGTATLTATANYGFTFSRWSDGSTDATHTVTVDGPATYTAFFIGDTFTVTATVADTSMGTTLGSGRYPYGTIAMVGALPKSGYGFEIWSDGSTQNPYPLTVTSDITVTATLVESHDTTTVTVHDTTVITRYIVDTTIVNTYDTSIYNHFRYDTTLNYDTMIVNVYTYDTSIYNNYRYDTVILNTYQYDTTLVNVYDTTIINTYDTTLVNVYDTVINNYYQYDTTLVYDTTIINTYQYDTTLVNVYDTVIRNYYQYDTTIVNTYDTSIYNHFRYDTTLVYDTMIVNVYTYDTSIYNNYRYDTIILNTYQYDTTIVYDTTIINTYQYDTTLVNIYDTIINNLYQYDTTIVNVYDTTIINVYDTTINNNYVYDTIIVNNYVYDTVIVNHHTYDTVNNYYHDTVNNYYYDTVIITHYYHDTVIINNYIYDTIYLYRYLHDTIYIHDTVFIHHRDTVNISGFDGDIPGQTEVLLYSNGGQIVVEGGEGMPVRVYDAVGRLLASRRKEEVYGGTPLRFDVPASGVYLVKVGDWPARRVVILR